MVVKEYYKYYVTKRRLYQHWPGSLIREYIIMVITICNVTFLNKILQEKTTIYSGDKYIWMGETLYILSSGKFYTCDVYIT